MKRAGIALLFAASACTASAVPASDGAVEDAAAWEPQDMSSICSVEKLKTGSYAAQLPKGVTDTDTMTLDRQTGTVTRTIQRGGKTWVLHYALGAIKKK